MKSEEIVNKLMKMIMATPNRPSYIRGGLVQPPKECLKNWVDAKIFNNSFYYKDLEGGVHVFKNSIN